MIEKLKTQMLNHDWYFDKADNLAKFTKGALEKDAILKEMKSLPLTEVSELFRLVPENFKDEWFMDLTSSIHSKKINDGN